MRAIRQFTWFLSSLTTSIRDSRGPSFIVGVVWESFVRASVVAVHPSTRMAWNEARLDPHEAERIRRTKLFSKMVALLIRLWKEV